MGLRERKEAILCAVRGAENLASILSDLGFEVEKKGGLYFTDLRGERTKSAQINKDGTVHDYGNDDHLGFLDLIVMKYPETNSFGSHVENYAAQIEKAEEILRIDGQGASHYVFMAPRLSKSEAEKREYITKPLEEGYIEYFRRQVPLNKSIVDELMEKFMPAATDEQRRQAISRFEIGFDPKRRRLTVPVRNAKGEIVHMFRYSNIIEYDEKGKPLPKIRYLSKRQRVLFNIEVLKTAPKVVYLLEGEKDVINATMNGRAAMTQGAAGGWKEWMPRAIQLACEYYKVPVPKFVIIQDHDKPGLQATLKIYKGLKQIQRDTKVLFWKQETAVSILNWKGRDEKLTKLVQEASLKPKDVGVIHVNPAKLTKGFDYTDWCVTTS